MLTFSYLLMTLLLFTGIFLIGLILLQRGRGGGLAGAFGGMGGQSAFGTKAGDVFTRITIGAAAVWILLCAGGVVTLRYASSGLRTDDSLFKKENAAEVKKARPADEAADETSQIPAGPSNTARPGNNTENSSAAPSKPTEPDEKKVDPQTEQQPKEKPKPTEPEAPAIPTDNPEPNKDKPAEDKPLDPPK